MSKKNDPPPFNNPFAKLQPKVKKEEPSKSKAAPRPPKAPPVSKKRSTDEEDAALFLESIGEVAPVRQKIERVAPPAPRSAGSLHIPTEEAESLARLAELVSADDQFDVSDSAERVEGWVVGFDARVMRKLRAGDFSAQAKVDLHGLVREEAKTTFESFIQKSRIAGHRCVLVVTGRGLHSPDSIPVIKQSVQSWLTRGKVTNQVLAFCSARAQDGGTGAVYVLLRR